MLFPYLSWWRNWSSTALARRKGTCDDVRLGSWKREGIQSRRMKWVAFVFKIKMFYGFDPTDHTFFWNGSLCWLRLGQAEHALYDANVCRELKPDWSKRCCFREGVALCFLQVKIISLLLQKAVDFERWNIIIHWVINDTTEICWGSQCLFTKE